MIEEYIHKGYVPINKDTVITWLKESVDFIKTRLTYDVFKNNKDLKYNLDKESEIIYSLENGVKYEDFNEFIFKKINLCESNKNYFISINKDAAYWDINIKLYKYLQSLLDDIKDFYETQQGQLQFF